VRQGEFAESPGGNKDSKGPDMLTRRWLNYVLRITRGDFASGFLGRIETLFDLEGFSKEFWQNASWET